MPSEDPGSLSLSVEYGVTWEDRRNNIIALLTMCINIRIKNIAQTIYLQQAQGIETVCPHRYKVKQAWIFVHCCVVQVGIDRSSNQTWGRPDLL